MFVKSFLRVVVASAVLAAMGAAHAATLPATAPAAVKLAVSGGLKYEATFPAPSGMTGWVLSQGRDQRLVVYTTADGKTALVGNMLDEKGNALTPEHLKKFAPAEDLSPLWSALGSSTWVAEGASDKTAKSTIYVFEDSNCGYCHLAWKSLQPYVTAGLQVRWVPVAFLAPNSFDKAAAVLTAQDPSAEFVAQRKAYDAKQPGKTVTPSKEIRAKIDENNKLMQEWGFRGTPAIIYKDKSGKVMAVSGMPDPKELAEITGMPAPK